MSTEAIDQLLEKRYEAGFVTDIEAFVAEEGREQVALHVVHAEQRQAGREREPASRLHADQQRADQAR